MSIIDEIKSVFPNCQRDHIVKLVALIKPKKAEQIINILLDNGFPSTETVEDVRWVSREHSSQSSSSSDEEKIHPIIRKQLENGRKLASFLSSVHPIKKPTKKKVEILSSDEDGEEIIIKKIPKKKVFDSDDDEEEDYRRASSSKAKRQVIDSDEDEDSDNEIYSIPRRRPNFSFIRNDEVERSPKSKYTPLYKKQAKTELYARFTDLSKQSIDDYFRMCNNDFTQTYNFIIKTDPPKMKRGPAIRYSSPWNSSLLGEISNLERLKSLASKKIRENEETTSTKSLKVECQCCFEKISVKNTINCSNDHPTCGECLKKYTNEIIYGSLGTSLRCPAMGCNEQFDHSQLKILPEDILEKLQLHELSTIENFHRCPFCTFGAIIEVEASSHSDNEMLFHCLRKNCSIVSCLKCKQKKHSGKTCEEVEEEMRKKLTLDEKKSETLIRKCPGCKIPFVLLDGCCHMTCPKCKVESCYICRKVLEKTKIFEHFCDHLHKPCSKCPGKCPMYIDVKKEFLNVSKIKE